ncbi:MAG: hypothetical protein ACI9O6_000105 [Glaciecola sp.]|jgi:hypothetical protein
MTDKNEHSIANFAALKTAIVNGEKQRVEELLPKKAIQDLEKGYLLDLAKINGNKDIIKLLEAIPANK